jgi:glycosyltransferase involved in cell wall biosynthesis
MRKRIILVAMADSSHVGRWIKNLTNQSNLDILFIPSSPHRRIQRDVKESGVCFETMGGKFRIHKFLKFFSLPIWVLDRGFLFDNRLRGWIIRRSIQRFNPHLIHVMETQNGGYPLSMALEYLERISYRKPPVLLTLFGSDIFWFSRFTKHRKKISTLLSQTNFVAVECQRDKSLSEELGYRGEFLPISPVAKGISHHQLWDQTTRDELLTRRSVAVKGYSGTWGLAHVAIAALALSKDKLPSLTVEIFSAEPGAIWAARKFLRPLGVKYKTFKKGSLSHTQVLELLRRSIIYIGLSRSDGLPSSMLEAMSQGAIPIQTNTACLEGWLVDGETGFAVSTPTPLVVSRLINKVLDSPEFMKAAREKNLDIVHKKYKLEEGNLEEEGIYETLVRK